VLRVADAVGALMEAWGFKRNMGRLWALLYLEQRPLSAADIGDRLALSTGAVSMLLTELQQWSIVKKTWIPGERREHYEAETSIWKMVSRVFRERELRWVEDALAVFEKAREELAAAPAAAPGATPGAAPGATTDVETSRAHLEARVAALTQLAQVGAHLLRAILDGAAVDAVPLKALGDLANAAGRASREPGKNET
jgi:HTH-type transcriptional regulator, glycine betaine synthesis regulator